MIVAILSLGETKTQVEQPRPVSLENLTVSTETCQHLARLPAAENETILGFISLMGAALVHSVDAVAS
ncbi:MAG: hypothetical protein WCZ02_03155 [Lysobacterales bacterium]